MYTPRPFREERIDVLHQAMSDVAFAAIVANGPAGLLATHAPVVLSPDPEPFGTLRCHFARANPHGAAMTPEGEVLVIFQGPQGYVSPSWYPSKHRTGEVVPTWNYVAIHAYGTAATHEDAGWLRSHLAELTGRFEGRPKDNSAPPWKIEDAPQEYIEGMCRAIVGVEIALTRIEGKWKLSQNRPDADRLGVVAGLRGEGDAVSLELAALVERAMAES